MVGHLDKRMEYLMVVQKVAKLALWLVRRWG